MPFVVDNPVVCGWFLDDQVTACSDAITERLRDERASVPALWELEFTNVPRTACLRQKMTAEAAQKVIAQIVSLPIDVESVPSGAPSIGGTTLSACATSVQVGSGGAAGAIRATACPRSRC